MTFRVKVIDPDYQFILVEIHRPDAIFALPAAAFQVKTVKVREMAQAIRVSQPYAADIRAGRHRPHPRHWQSLGDLVGVSRNSPRESN
jgi:hypothetical protein